MAQWKSTKRIFFKVNETIALSRDIRRRFRKFDSRRSRGNARRNRGGGAGGGGGEAGEEEAAGDLSLLFVKRRVNAKSRANMKEQAARGEEYNEKKGGVLIAGNVNCSIVRFNYRSARGDLTGSLLARKTTPIII